MKKAIKREYKRVCLQYSASAYVYNCEAAMLEAGITALKKGTTEDMLIISIYALKQKKTNNVSSVIMIKNLYF